MSNGTFPSVKVAAASSNSKILYAMRHGITEMNAHMTHHPYNADFKDPKMYDTRLTTEGKNGAVGAAAHVEKLNPKPEVVVISPLTRALQTYELAWAASTPCPVVVEPLARERLWLSSDVGRMPAQLKEDFQDPRYCFDNLPDIWWHSNGNTDPLAIVPESVETFRNRMVAFRSWIMGRPERVIGLVSHWGVLAALCNHDFKNCEVACLELKADGEVVWLEDRQLLPLNRKMWE